MLVWFKKMLAGNTAEEERGGERKRERERENGLMKQQPET